MSLVWLDLGLNPGLPGHWRTLEPLYIYIYIYRERERESYSIRHVLAVGHAASYPTLWHQCLSKFTYLGSSVSSTEKDIDTRLTKAWTAIDRLSIIWKSDLTDKMKRGFFQAVVVSILLYGCTTWTLTKRLEKKLDGNYTRMLRTILNKSWRQHPTRHQLYGHLPPSRKPYKLDGPDTRDTAGEARTSS